MKQGDDDDLGAIGEFQYTSSDNCNSTTFFQPTWDDCFDGRRCSWQGGKTVELGGQGLMVMEAKW
ncbi:penicillin-binding protein 2 [Sesbania bispinosa]|nr:penicillin-binding protein 2 [Sesbania bispinosa]